MNKIKLSAILFVTALFPGCGTYRSDASLNSGAKGSPYSVNSAPASVEPDEAATELRAANAAANTASTSVRAAKKKPVRNVIQKTSLAEVQATQDAPVTIERKVIRNADLQLEAQDPAAVQERISSIAESKGGYVVESQQSAGEGQVKVRDMATMTLRIPADRFAETLNEIRSAGDAVVQETVKGEDVTEEFIDVEARLKAQKALEQQYIEIMKRAYSVEDALYVQSELAEVRGEIEKIEGRKRYLENQSSLSTIKVTLQTAGRISAGSAGFGRKFGDSLNNGLDIALNFILGLVTLVIGVLPFALFIGLPGFLIGRHLWRKRNRPMSVAEIAKQEIKNE